MSRKEEQVQHQHQHSHCSKMMIATRHAPATTTTAALILVAIAQQLSVSLCNGFSFPTLALSPFRPTQQYQPSRSSMMVHSLQLQQRQQPRATESNNNNRNIGHASSQYATSSTSSSSLKMGLFDFIQETFLDSREDGDFVPLEQSDTFGPGPLILMYAVPDSMGNEELMDMVEDGMPKRRGGDVVIRRISGMEENENSDGEGGDGGGDDALLDLTVEQALNKAMENTMKSAPSISAKQQQPIVVSYATAEAETTPCPVLYFSGVSNAEMMDTYKIIANEIFEETNRVHWPACAKVVPPAMEKQMRRVLMEISGDHADAMRMRREEAEKANNMNTADN